MALDVNLADGFTEASFYQRDSALPTFTQLRSARESGAVDSEVLINDLGALIRGAASDDMPGEP